MTCHLQFVGGHSRQLNNYHTSVTIENRIFNDNYFITKTQEIIPCSNFHKSRITLYKNRDLSNRNQALFFFSEILDFSVVF